MGTPVSIDQMRDAARRRLPRFAFDFIDGGAGREFTLAANTDDFRRIALAPRILTGCRPPVLTTRLFGRDYAAPFGVAPMGLPAMAWPGADLGLARAAAKAGIPFVVSAAASITVEQAVQAAPGLTWFQLYPGRSHASIAAFLERVAAAGVQVLVLTVDRPVMGWRTRDLKNGLSLPFKPSLHTLASLATHPGWSLATLRAGAPRIANPELVDAPGQQLSANEDGPTSAADWAFLAGIRSLWRGPLLVKGVMHADDAVRAIEAGADGVVVSNHGGGHLEGAAASITRLAGIRAALGQGPAVLFDGGVRSGEDVAKALALGADFVLLGRAFAYGVAALGPAAGPDRTVAIMGETLSSALALLGCRSPSDLTGDHIA